MLQQWSPAQGPQGQAEGELEVYWRGLQRPFGRETVKVVAPLPCLLCVCVQGSGWGWLGYNKASKGLEIVTCANQDPLAAKVGGNGWGLTWPLKAPPSWHRT